MNKIITRLYESPCGTLILGSFGDKLCLCDWLPEKNRDRLPEKNRDQVHGRLRRILGAEFEEGSSAVTDNAVIELDEYFARRRRQFDIPLLFAGTDFQKKVWAALLAIPYGATVSYAEMAQLIGMPRAVRAVAGAIGANSISIFAPCHRVIGSGRALTGYAGGLAAKKHLLSLENAL